MWGYADDCALSAFREAWQEMLNICSQYFEEHGIKISVNVEFKKSQAKSLAFYIKPPNIILNGRPLPWVESHKHLGHNIHNDSFMSHDIFSKFGIFKSNVCALTQDLRYQSPVVF